MTAGLAALSIDLDALRHYHRIHGLPDPAVSDGPDPVYGKAAARFGELCQRLGLHGTAFAVGEELTDPAAAAGVAALARAGHEVGNHTFSHDYRLTRRPAEEIEAEVRRGAQAIADATGTAPRGFRAPGYTISAPLLAVLRAQGYRYDSSAFPAIPYWLAKAAVMGALRLTGRPSRALLDRPRVLLAPRAPYRPDPEEPYRGGAERQAGPAGAWGRPDPAGAAGHPDPAGAAGRPDPASTAGQPDPASAAGQPGLAGAGEFHLPPRRERDLAAPRDLVELPVTTGLFGFPLVGTFVATLPPGLLRALCAGTARLPLFNLELHGVDLLDASDASPELAARQRDLRVPAREKIARIERFVRSLGGREWVRLGEAAERVG